MKKYIISKKKSKERNEKIKVKISNTFLGVKTRFFYPENEGKDINS
jgi:hypothetical protein